MKVIGILGGMGPRATVDLFEKIVDCTPARVDQEHLKIIVYNNPQIPSRIDALVRATESPRAELIKSARFLEKAGADIIVIPCNTAHFWYQDVQDAVNIQIINMIEVTACTVEQFHSPEASRNTLLLASDGTIKARIYHQVFEQHRLSLQTPDAKEQKIIASAIDEVKAGCVGNNQYLSQLQAMIEKYSRQGISSVIGGCTEIPLLFHYLKGNYRQIDPTRLLAQAVVKQATA